MTYTDAIKALNRRLGPWAALCDPGDAISRALLALGLTVTTYGTPVDDDFTKLAVAATPQFLDIAEYEALVTACNNADEVTLRASGIVTAEADAQRMLTRKVEMKLQYIRQRYAYGLQELQIGIVDLNTVADDSESDNVY